MRRARQLLARSRFARNTAWMTMASLGAHGLYLVVAPVLTRIFTPADFALLTLFTTAQAVILSFATGRVEWSVPNARGTREAAALLCVAMGVLAVVSVLLLVAVALFTQEIAQRAGLAPTARPVLYLLPFSVFMTGMQAVLQSWYIARGALKSVSISRLVQSAAFSAVSILAGLVRSAPQVLIASFALSQILAGLTLALGMGGFLRESRRLRPRFLGSVVARYGTEIVFSALSSVASTAAFYAPVLMIWVYFEPTVLGWFALILRVGTAPLNLLTASLSKGFWAEAAQLAKEDPAALRRLFLKVTKYLAVIGVAFALVCLAGPLYFGWVFGEAWAGAGWLLAAMTPMLVPMLVFNSTSHLIVYRKQHWQLGCDMLTLVLFVGAFAVSARLGLGPAQVIAVASLAYTVSYALRFALHLRANARVRRV